MVVRGVSGAGSDDNGDGGSVVVELSLRCLRQTLICSASSAAEDFFNMCSAGTVNFIFIFYACSFMNMCRKYTYLYGFELNYIYDCG